MKKVILACTAVLGFMTITSVAKGQVIEIDEPNQTISVSGAYSDENTKVYVNNYGKAPSYFYSYDTIKNLEMSVNLDAVVTMSEAEAKAAGKIHSDIEKVDVEREPMKEGSRPNDKGPLPSTGLDANELGL